MPAPCVGCLSSLRCMCQADFQPVPGTIYCGGPRISPGVTGPPVPTVESKQTRWLLALAGAVVVSSWHIGIYCQVGLLRCKWVS